MDGLGCTRSFVKSQDMVVGPEGSPLNGRRAPAKVTSILFPSCSAPLSLAYALVKGEIASTRSQWSQILGICASFLQRKSPGFAINKAELEL